MAASTYFVTINPTNVVEIPGPSGAAATISLGGTTTGAPGSPVLVTNSGTPSAAVFHFTIPPGSNGPPGTTNYNALTNKPTLGTAAALNVPLSTDASTSQVVTGADSRLTNFRTPLAHASSHSSVSTDPIAISKSQVTDFPAIGTAAALNVATSGDATTTQAVTGTDSRLTDARTPVGHKVSHVTGADIIPAPTTSAPGLSPALPSTNQTLQFLRGDASFAPIPAATASAAGLLTALPASASTNYVARGDNSWTLISGLPITYTQLVGVPATFSPSTHHAAHITAGADVIPSFSSTASGLVPLSGGGTTNFLRADGTFATPPGSSYSVVTASAIGLAPTLPASANTTYFLRGDATWALTSGISIGYTNLTGVPTSFAPSSHKTSHVTGGADVIPSFTSTASGLVPLSGGGTANYLRADGTFATPPSAGLATASASGLIATLPASASTNYVARGDNSWTLISGLPITYTQLTGVPASFTPSTHHAAHVTGGADIIPAPTISASGLVPILPASSATAQFLRGDGSFARVVATPATLVISSEIWISLRTDGAAGTGTLADPFDGSTALKFDAIMHTVANGTTIHLAPGVFLTDGSQTGFARTDGKGCILPNGCKLIGAGIGITTVKLNSIATGQNQPTVVAAYVGANSPYCEVREMTVDGNYAAFTLPSGYVIHGVILNGDNSKIVNVEVINTYGLFATLSEGFACNTSGNNTLIDGCYCHSFHGDYTNGPLSGGNNCVISNCHVEGANHGFGFAGVDGGSIYGCSTDITTTVGYYVDTGIHKHINIKNNTFRASKIPLQFNPPNGNCIGIVIEGNYFESSNATGTSNAAIIISTIADQVRIANNVYVDSGNSTTGFMLYFGNSTHVTVEGNHSNVAAFPSGAADWRSLFFQGTNIFGSLDPLSYTSLKNLPSLSTIATPSVLAITSEIWVSLRTDGAAGTGTLANPFDGSTALKFDAIINSAANGTTIHLAPGVFLTDGSNTGFPRSDGKGSLLPRSSKLIGAGIGITTVRLNSISAQNQPMVLSTFSSSNSLCEVRELTVDGNYSAFTLPSGYCIHGVSLSGNNSKIVNVEMINAYGLQATNSESVSLTTSGNNTLIDGCYVHSFHGDFTNGPSSTGNNVVISNCHVEGGNHGYGLFACDGATLYGCSTDINTKVGFYVDTGTCFHVSINGNTIRAAVLPIQFNTTPGNSKGLVIAGNYLESSNATGSANAAIQLSLSDQVRIANNVYVDSGNQTTGFILYFGDSTHVTVEGNHANVAAFPSGALDWRNLFFQGTNVFGTLDPLSYTSLKNLPSLSTIATPSVLAITSEIWVSLRTDGAAGTGTLANPFDGSTAVKFDAIMNAVASFTTVHLAPGVFMTNGSTFTGFRSDSKGWHVTNGVKLIGAGMGATTLRLNSLAPGAANAATIIVSSGGGTGGSAMEVRDITLDGNYSNLTVPTNNAIDGIYLVSDHAKVVNVEVINLYGVFNAGSGAESFGCNITGNNSIVDSCYFHGYHGDYHNGPLTGSGSNCTITNCRVEGANHAYGFSDADGGILSNSSSDLACGVAYFIDTGANNHISIVNNVLRASVNPIQFNVNVTNILIQGNYIENNNTSGATNMCIGLPPGANQVRIANNVYVDSGNQTTGFIKYSGSPTNITIEGNHSNVAAFPSGATDWRTVTGFFAGTNVFGTLDPISFSALKNIPTTTNSTAPGLVPIQPVNYAPNKVLNGQNVFVAPFLDPYNRIQIIDDFHNGLGMVWTETVANSAPVAVKNDTTALALGNVDGTVTLSTGALANGSDTIYIAKDFFISSLSALNVSFRYRLRQLSTSTQRFTLQFGLSDNPTGTPNNAAYVQYVDSINSGHWEFVRYSSGTAQTIVAGDLSGNAPVTAGWSVMSLFYDGTSISATVSGQFVIGGEAPAFSGPVGPFCSLVKSIGTTPCLLDLDLFVQDETFATPRLP